MATLTYVNMIFLGTYASVDTNESNTSAESEADLLGLYEDLALTRVGEHDRDSSGWIADDEAMGDREDEERDFLDYDVGFGPEAYEIDTTMQFNVEITQGDGTVTNVQAAIIQTTIGDVFVRDLNDNLDNLNIQSIRLVSVVNDNFSGSMTRRSVENSEIVCFRDGTLIDAPGGARAVETLRTGDLVMTQDHGAQPVRWIGTHPLPRDAHLSAAHGSIAISQGALGAGLPTRDLHVSPDHRILIRSAIARRMFDVAEVLIPAKRLLGLPGISRSPAAGGDARYIHLLLDRHAVLTANGALVESMLPGPQVLKRLRHAPLRDLRTALATMGQPAGLGYLPARMIPPGHMQRRLIWRHKRNAQPLFAQTTPTPRTCEPA